MLMEEAVIKPSLVRRGAALFLGAAFLGGDFTAGASLPRHLACRALREVP
jgi:hypothetical protein